MRWLGIAAALPLMLAACSPHPEPPAGSAEPAPSQPAPDMSGFRIKLERGVCFGTCPFYTVEIRGDGLVEYCGVEFVKEKGRRSRTISPQEIQPLIALLSEADFFSLNDRYVAAVDSPVYVVSASFAGRRKTITETYGENMGLPRAVTQLEDAIDTIAGTVEWVGEGPSNDKPYPGSTPIPDCLRDPGTVSYIKPDAPPSGQ